MSDLESPPSDESVEWADPAVLAADLVDALRAVRRRMRRGAKPEGLGATQVELLRRIVNSPGSSVSALAAECHMAPNTVSTLVGQLVTLGYVSRFRDPADLRVARFESTQVGEAQVAELRDRYATVVSSALHHMRPEDQRKLARAVPALRTLAELLS